MNLKSLSESELREARRAGFKRKKPKKGKLKTMNAIEGYADRWNRFVDDAKAKIQEKKKEEAEKQRVKQLREKIRRH